MRWSHAAHRVSTTLNRDNKMYGKKFMLDGSDETCWNSDQVNARGGGLMLEANMRLCGVGG